MGLRGAVLLSSVLALLAGPLRSEDKPSFEVATVKPADPNERNFAFFFQPGGRLRAAGAPLRMVIAAAYSVRDFQISGGPAWISSDRWNIEAKAEEGAVPDGPARPGGPMLLMVQSLLEDRFGLRVHRETRQAPIYNLTIARSGLKMKLSEDQNPPSPANRPAPPKPGEPPPPGMMRFRPGHVEARGVPLANIVQMLSDSAVLGQPVLDQTDLKGLYDIELEWTPQVPPPPGSPELQAAPPDNAGPSIFTALQEQLGLKLESARGPVDVLIIDAVAKPAAN